MKNKEINFAKYFTIKLKEKNFTYENLKIQKLLWYCQILWYKYYGKKLFEENFKAWLWGVILEEVWKQRKEIKNVLDPNNCSEKEKIVNMFEYKNNYKNLVDKLISKKGEWSGFYLSAENHKQQPWIETRQKGNNEIVEWKLIEKYAINICDNFLK